MDDKIWIFPAKEDAIGPIEDSSGKVLTVDAKNVRLEAKEMFCRQKWNKDSDSNEFRLTVTNDANEKKHLSAPSDTILTGTFQ